MSEYFYWRTSVRHASIRWTIHQMTWKVIFWMSGSMKFTWRKHLDFPQPRKERLVSNLGKSLYRLKQVPMDWYLGIDEHIDKLGSRKWFKFEPLMNTTQVGDLLLIILHFDALILMQLKLMHFRKTCYTDLKWQTLEYCTTILDGSFEEIEKEFLVSVQVCHQPNQEIPNDRLQGMCHANGFRMESY